MGLAGFVGWLLEKVLTTKITGSEHFFSDDYFFWSFGCGSHGEQMGMEKKKKKVASFFKDAN